MNTTTSTNDNLVRILRRQNHGLAEGMIELNETLERAEERRDQALHELDLARDECALLRNLGLEEGMIELHRAQHRAQQEREQAQQELASVRNQCEHLRNANQIMVDERDKWISDRLEKLERSLLHRIAFGFKSLVRGRA